MNILFVSHCDFSGNSAMHIFSIANHLAQLGIHCAVCVPNDPDTIRTHGTPNFEVVPYTQTSDGVRFADGRGPDLIHAWTPRELVRKLTQRLAEIHACPYLVHMEDNEEVILESESGYTFAELERLPPHELEALVPEHRSHPLHYKKFLEGAAGMTALMDRLLEFKPSHAPGLVFWPGFDEHFRELVGGAADAPWRRHLDAQTILVYTGNIHDTNAAEVRSLFLAVQTLRRAGRSIRLLKTGWNYIQDREWIETAVNSGAVADLGFLPRCDLPALLSAATLLVQPGRPGRFNDYRFPSKLPEFLVSGKPVLLPRTNLGRFLREDIDAALLQEGNAIEIAGKIESLLDDSERAAGMGRNGQKFALRRLAWEKNVPPIKTFYETVLASRPKKWTHETAAFSDATPDSSQSPRLIAFYLPQFHPIPENDKNWGKGFTEWTNVTQARPNFIGHHQPQLPADLGFYDLRVPEVLEQQAALARQYGIHGFCFYYYWFNGRRVLERPLEEMCRSGRPDFPFCLCWANENWTRNWDGSTDELLIMQDYSSDACERFIRDVIPYFDDSRYIRVNGAPVLLVYRPDQLPDPARTAQMWRQVCASEGVGEIHLCAVQSFGIRDPRDYGFDAAVEFPPHTKRALVDPESFPGLSPDFEGYLEDYPAIVSNQLALPWPDYTWYRGVMPAWDNTARRGTRAHILINSSPDAYERWLRTVVEQTRQMASVQEPLLFVNAWNEWAEGAYLEPDQRLGHARLRATQRALSMRPATGGEQEARVKSSAASAPEPKTSIDPAMAPLVHRYQKYPTEPLSHGTVRDFCDSFEHLNQLATLNGDLKDLQRPWILKAVLSKVPRPGRVLEIGAGEPFVADLLSKMGYEAWIVDPYDGSGNGPVLYEEYRKRYPHLRFVKSQFHENLEEVPAQAFDCIYSISVLEHIPPRGLESVCRGLRKSLKRSGVSIHAVDHVHRGNGAAEHLANLRLMTEGFGFSQTCLDSTLTRLTEDHETYFLSAESHNRWRGSMTYDEFPMRVCVSIHFISSAAQISALS